MTPIYIRNDNLKKIWELLDVWVEFGFGTVCRVLCGPWVELVRFSNRGVAEMSQVGLQGVLQGMLQGVLQLVLQGVSQDVLQGVLQGYYRVLGDHLGTYTCTTPCTATSTTPSATTNDQRC